LRPTYLPGVNAVKDNRLKLILQYDGSAFHGWQIQREERTVQGELEAALEQLTSTHRPVIGSGRTDRGVHATGQVAVASLPDTWQPEKLEKALSAVLPDDIWIKSVETASPDFHPRYDAVKRTYLYHLGLSRESASPFHRHWCWPLGKAVDEGLLDSAAETIVGEHSFKAFAKTGQPERGDRCVIHESRWEPWEQLGLTFRISADRFLHHMVRYLVGTMVEIARGKRPSADLGRLLEEPESGLLTSPPAPPTGLFLHHVTYPAQPPAGNSSPPGNPRHQVNTD
jgi:tRNA pseudouridine38-40 synthase